MGLFYLFFVSSCRSLGVMQPHTSSQEEDCGAVGMDIGGKGIIFFFGLSYMDRMRRIVILQKEIKDCHSCDKVFSTDAEYAEMAGELVTIIREEKLSDMPDVMFIIRNTLHVFLATLYIRIGKRIWAFRLKRWHGKLLCMAFDGQ